LPASGLHFKLLILAHPLHAAKRKLPGVARRRNPRSSRMRALLSWMAFSFFCFFAL
jgi:hypothetical protein